MENLSQHIDEIEVLSSIYGADWKAENEAGTEYSMQVTSDVKLFVTFISEYPSNSPPKYELQAPLMSSQQKKQIATAFDVIASNDAGSPILFQWIEKLKELVTVEKEVTLDEAVLSESQVLELQKGNVKKYNIENVVHGPLIQDRKSVFQGHACKVTTNQEFKNFMDYLLENKKIAQATHNISAYRIILANGVLLQDCDDDGETHAGGRLLHLLQITDCQNVGVVVTRWYGGIHLGPDRFRHINNAARQVLLEAGFIKSEK